LTLVCIFFCCWLGSIH